MLKEYDDKALIQKSEDEIKALEIIQETKFNAMQNNFKITQDALDEIKRENQKYADMTAQAWKSGFNRIMDHSLSFKEKMIAVAQEIALHFAKMQAIKSLTPLSKGSGFSSTMAKGALALMGSFDVGGITPGNFGQPVPIISHGGEWNVNPKGQDEILKTVKNAANGEAKQTGVNYVYAPQIKTGASPEDVFRVLETHSRTFFSKVADGVRRDSTLRNAVRGA